jgi:TonB family protein
MFNKLARAALITLLLTPVIAPAPIAAQRRRAFSAENAMRQFAKNPVMPAYPEAALRVGVQGLAVALVTYDGDTGEVVKVEILKTPDESIAEAVRDALKQWKFNPANHPSIMGTTIEGTLRFDFSIEDGKGRVQYGSLDGVCFQQPGRQMPDGTLRQRLEDIDTPCGK